ncbi:transposase [Leptospira kirschneri]|uniref:transposase n=2 Tax=Leptospira kirschneri TaxID=29507 RepID=UPI001E4006AD|nr:transposase [Leptospira kirschneri]
METNSPIHPERKGKSERRSPTRLVMADIIYRMKTGCQWRAIPNEFGSGQTCHRRFQEWERVGVFKKIYSASQNSSSDNRSETA